MRTASLSNLAPFSKCSSLSWSMLITRWSMMLISRLAARVSRLSPVDLPEYDVHRADDRDRFGDHAAPGDLVHRSEVREARRADLQPPRLVGAVGHEEDAELALRVLDGAVHLARRDVHAFAEELEVVDQLFHALLHLDARGRRHLVVRGDHRAGVLAQPVDALLDDAVGLAHLVHAHEIAVVAIAVGADRDVEVELVVNLVRLLLAQVPRDARAAQHGPREAQRLRALRRDHADADGALLPDAVAGEQRLVVVHVLREAPGEVLDEIEHRALALLLPPPA